MPRTSLRTAFPFLVAGLTTLAGVLPAKKAAALSPYLVVPAPSVAEASAAYKYANMTAAEALAELDKRKVPYKVADPIDGVLAPVRLTGKLHGVHIHSSIPESQRATSVYEVLDARLALALDDFAKILSRHDIEEVVHYSLYRPNVPRVDHDLKDEAVSRKAPAAETAPAAKAGTADVKAATVEAKASVPAGKVGTATVPAGAPAGKAGTVNAKAGAAAVKAGAAAVKAGAPATKAVPVKQGAPAAKAGAVPAKQGAPAAKLPSALPSLPSGKAFPSPPSKGGAGAHGAKQKTPATAAKARPASPRASAALKKAGGTPQVRPRVGAVAKVQSKASAPARIEAKTAAVKVEPKAAPAPAPAVAAAPAVHTHKHSHGTRQTWAAPGTRHPAGLAIDVAMLKKRDGQWVSVATHFRGKIGDKTCGDGVRTGDTPEARELRSIVCESNDLGVFTYVLTPNFNAAHYDHFHMEIRPQVKWFLYQ